MWKLIEVRERGTGRGVAYELMAGGGEGKEENWNIALKETSGPVQPVELDIVAVLRDMTWNESTWATRALNFTLPVISGARRSESFLGIYAHDSMDIAFGEMPAWKSNLAGTLTRLNVPDTAVRAGLASVVPGGEVRLELSHTPPRGEYESVIHVQTTEREIWVRAEIRMLALERCARGR